MNYLIDSLLRRYKTVNLLLFFLVLMGLNAYFQIPKEATPDVKIPINYISLIYEGISPKDAEELLVKPVEEEVRSIDGLKEVRATAFNGGANIIMEFYAGFDSEKARLDGREKLDTAKPKLPEGVKEPTLFEVNLSQMPVLLVKLSGDAPDRVLYKIARDLADDIKSRISTVLDARLVGVRDEAVEIILTPENYEQYGLNLQEALLTFTRNHKIITAGVLQNKKGAFNISVPGLLDNAEAIINLPILSQGNSVAKLKDIASVRSTFKDPLSLARERLEVGMPSQNTVALEIVKKTGENLIETVRDVRAIVAEAQKGWPDNIKPSFANDDSDRVKDMLHELQNGIITAILLVMAVVVFSLGWRSALMVGFALPGAFLMGILAIYALGYTVNTVVLFSLIFSVGMLVDGAVIIVEYADRRMDEGVHPKAAYLESAKRMAWPVITSISTILVVFMPLLVWPGVVGQFMKFMPITLIAVLTASILMALIFLPAIVQAMPEKAFKRSTLTETKDWLSGRVLDLYKEALVKALETPKKVLLGAVALLVVVKLIHSFLGKGVEFFPDIEPDSAAIDIHSRGNTSIFENGEIIKQVENKIKDINEFASVFTNVGAGDAEDSIGIIRLEFAPWQKRRKVNEIVADMEKRVKDIPGIFVEIVKFKAGPSGGKPIQIQLSSPNREILTQETQRLRKLLEDIKEAGDVEDDLPIPGIEWKYNIDREEAMRLGTDILAIGQTIKLVTNGSLIATYRPQDSNKEVDILLRFDENNRTLDNLNTLRIKTKNGAVPLSQIAKREPAPKVARIYRADGKPVQNIMADVKPGFLVSEVIEKIKSEIKNAPLHEQVKIKFKGEDEDRQEASSFLIKAFMVAIFLVAVILVTQFNSFFSMGLVMSSVVMSTIGVFVGLLVHNLAFGVVMGGIGIIALAGIIVSNNIILIDTYDKLMAELKERKPRFTIEDCKNVIIETCTQRFRPVILTKLTTILGLLPIMFGVNLDFIKFEITVGAPSSQWWVLLATCIVYGVLFASSLTLFVTPSALLLRAQRRMKNNF